MAPPFEQTLITQIQGLTVCNIKEFCFGEVLETSFGDEDFKILETQTKFGHFSIFKVLTKCL